MRAQFISDNLAAASKPVRIFRDMIGSQNIDIAADLREERIRDSYPAAFAFYDNIYHNYNINELLFITKRAYSLAGVKNSLILLGRYFGIDFVFMAPKNGNPDDMTDPDAFGKTYWKIYLLANTPGGMVFKSVKVAINTINALVEELVFHASNTADPDNIIKLEIIVQEDDLKNMDRDFLNITQTPLVDKYFDENNTFLHSLDMDSRYSLSFRNDEIEMSATNPDAAPFQFRYKYLYLMIRGDAEAYSGESTCGTGFTVAKLDYPRIHSGVRYKFEVREFFKNGDNWEAGNWKPVGNRIAGFRPSSGAWILRDDVEIKKGVTLDSAGTKGYTLRFINSSVPGKYAVYYKLAGSSSWVGQLDSPLEAGGLLQVPYSRISGHDPSPDASFALAQYIDDTTPPGPGFDPDTDEIYYLANPPYIIE